MIGQLHGILIHKRPPQLVLDVSGVGYELDVPMSTFYELPDVGAEVTLLTHFLVRDDAHILYGFITAAERSLFRNLLKVNGVGARMALTLMSGISVGDFARCIRDGDTATLTRLPGIGKKTADRLVVELRDRLTAMEDVAPEQGADARSAVTTASDPVRDAVSALVTLGYKPAEASRMTRDVATADLSSEEIIRLALRSIVS